VRRAALACAVVLTAAGILVVAAGRDDEPSPRLSSGHLPSPQSAFLLGCGREFTFAGRRYQVRSGTPWRPGRRLGTATLRGCDNPSDRIAVSIHAYKGVDRRLALGVRAGATLLALSRSRCLGYTYEELTGCLRDPDWRDGRKRGPWYAISLDRGRTESDRDLSCVQLWDRPLKPIGLAYEICATSGPGPSSFRCFQTYPTPLQTWVRKPLATQHCRSGVRVAREWLG
jgi:hypothetical protein